MNYTTHLLLLLALQTTDSNAASFMQNSIKKITSFFTPHSLEKIDHKELPTTSLTSIAIENYNGPITIKTGWKKNYLCLKTIRRAKKQIDLDAIKIVADSTQSHHLAITTKHTGEKIKGSVEYELIVPASLTVSLKTEHGDISINDIEGSVRAITNNGSISVINASNSIYAESTTRGNICIQSACGPVEALSYTGDITINNAHSSVTAHSTKGKIIVDYVTLPYDSSVQLATTTGNITLTTPPSTQAQIKGSTLYGTVFSDHYITLDSYTTQLNNNAWNKFKKEVKGVIGSEQAHISLCSTHGNIKILQTKTT